MTIEVFAEHPDEDLKRLSDELRMGTYRPQAIRRHDIPKPGSSEKRPRAIPTIRDLVVQTALRMVLGPIFEDEFAEQSYGFRPGRGCKDSLRRVDELLESGFTYIVDADLKSDFDTIPHDRLMTLVGQKVSDGRVLTLIKAFRKQNFLYLGNTRPLLASHDRAPVGPGLCQSPAHVPRPRSTTSISFGSNTLVRQVRTTARPITTAAAAIRIRQASVGVVCVARQNVDEIWAAVTRPVADLTVAAPVSISSSAPSKGRSSHRRDGTRFTPSLRIKPSLRIDEEEPAPARDGGQIL